MARVLLLKAGRISHAYPLVTPPIGLMQLAAVLRQEGGHEPSIHDMRALGTTPGALSVVLERERPQIVGVSALTAEAEDFFAAIEAVRRWDPDVPVIAGGPFPTSYVENVLERGRVQAVIVGEGEVVIREVVDRLLEGRPLSGLAGVAYQGPKGPVLSGYAPSVEDIESLPRLAYDLIDFSAYARNMTMTPLAPRRYMSLYTSRGCPFGCAYCHNIFGRKFRALSPERVVDEIEFLVDHHDVREFEIVDDIFNFDKARAKRIFDLVRQRVPSVRFTFPNAVRGDMLDEELLDKMKAAGTYFVSFAPETYNAGIQSRIHKNVNFDKLTRYIDYAVDIGLFCNGFFMLGFPGETEEEMRNTVQYALDSRLHTASFFVVTAFRGTQLWEQLGGDVDAFVGENSFALNAANHSAVPDAAFQRILREANFKFYFGRGRFLRILRDYPAKRAFPRMAYLIMQRMVRGLGPSRSGPTREDSPS